MEKLFEALASKVVDVIKSPLLPTIGLLASAFLLASGSLQQSLSVAAFFSARRAETFLVFVISAAWLFSLGVVGVVGWGSRRRQENQREAANEREMHRILDGLDPQAVGLLMRAADSRQNAFVVVDDHPGIAGLRERGIINRSVFGPIAQPFHTRFTVNPDVYRFVREHRDRFIDVDSLPTRDDLA